VWQAFALLSTFKTSSEDTDSGSSIANSRSLKESRIGRFLTLPSHKYRHIHFLDFNRQGVISYAVKILYLGLKEKVGFIRYFHQFVSRIVSTNFSQFEQLKMKTKFLLFQDRVFFSQFAS
jgi:hypothetical protein